MEAFRCLTCGAEFSGNVDSEIAAQECCMDDALDLTGRMCECVAGAECDGPHYTDCQNPATKMLCDVDGKPVVYLCASCNADTDTEEHSDCTARYCAVDLRANAFDCPAFTGGR